MTRPEPRFTVLHFTAAEADRGGILTVVRALSGAGLGRAVTAVNRGLVQERGPALKLWRGTTLPSETINPRAMLQAAIVAFRLRGGLSRRSRIFHGHTRAGLLVGLWLWLSGFDRVIVTVHCHGRQRWFYRFAALLLGQRLVWLTPAMKRHYDVGSGSWRGCLPNFLPAAGKADLSPRPTDEKRLKLGGIGTLVRWKGWHHVVDALGQLPPVMRARVEFHHVGSGDGSVESERYQAELKASAKAQGVGAQFHWRGEERSATALLSDIDVLVIPSDGEPFGLGVLEAWRAGVPVLAADGGGPAELITVGRDGWLFAKGSPTALAEAVRMLWETKAYRETRPTLPASEAIVAQWKWVYADVVGDAGVVV